MSCYSLGYMKTVLLRMSDEDHAKAKRLAREEGVTLNDFFLERLPEGVRKRTSLEVLTKRIDRLERRVKDGNW